MESNINVNGEEKGNLVLKPGEASPRILAAIKNRLGSLGLPSLKLGNTFRRLALAATLTSPVTLPAAAMADEAEENHEVDHEGDEHGHGEIPEAVKFNRFTLGASISGEVPQLPIHVKLKYSYIMGYYTYGDDGEYCGFASHKVGGDLEAHAHFQRKHELMFGIGGDVVAQQTVNCPDVNYEGELIDGHTHVEVGYAYDHGFHGLLVLEPGEDNGVVGVEGVKLQLGYGPFSARISHGHVHGVPLGHDSKFSTVDVDFDILKALHIHGFGLDLGLDYTFQGPYEIGYGASVRFTIGGH